MNSHPQNDCIWLIHSTEAHLGNGKKGGGGGGSSHYKIHMYWCVAMSTGI